MRFCFDLDGIICFTQGTDYYASKPDTEIINLVNSLHKKGHYIIIFTARGMGEFFGDADKAYSKWFSFTKRQLKKWGVLYHDLMLGKPNADYYIDDKHISINYLKNMDI